jgi:hypothetical protein
MGARSIPPMTMWWLLLGVPVVVWLVRRFRQENRRINRLVGEFEPEQDKAEHNETP